MALTERDRAILELERTWWSKPGPKTTAIRDRLGISPSRYYELREKLAFSEEAMAHDPLVVLRLRRASGQRRRARYEGRPARRRPDKDGPSP